MVNERNQAERVVKLILLGCLKLSLSFQDYGLIGEPLLTARVVALKVGAVAVGLS
jgi:hypothetical protein